MRGFIFGFRAVPPIEKQNPGGANMKTNKNEYKNTLSINAPSQRLQAEIEQQRLREEAAIRIAAIGSFTGHRSTYWR
jgi:hypothetical protein